MASELRRLTQLNPNMFGDLVRAGIELAIARLRLDSQHVRSLINVPFTGASELDERQAALVERVAFAIPRVAARLPWRADCLVQALAASRWLDRLGIPTTLTLGVRKDMPTDFEAHAWLTANNHIVTGGDISGHVPLTRP